MEGVQSVALAMKALLASTSGVGFVAAGLAFLGVMANLWWQGRRDEADDRRKLRDGRRDRLRDAYAGLLEATWRFTQVVRDLKTGERYARQLERDLELLKEATNTLDHFRAVLSLEVHAESEAILGMADEVIHTTGELMLHVTEAAGGVEAPIGAPLSSEIAGLVDETDRKLYALTFALEAAARAHLAKHERPIRPSPWPWHPRI